MNPKHFHTPLSTRARCPVCHEAVYSRAGIHPQCAVRQADPPKPKAKPVTPPFPGQPASEDVEPAGDDVVIEPPIADKLSLTDRAPV
jgi:hypothetical protein